MKKIAALICIALLPVMAHAQPKPMPEHWVYARTRDGALGYETNVAIRDAQAGTANGYFFIYSPMPLALNGIQHNFEEVEADFDCRMPRWRSVSTIIYDKSGVELGEFAPINDAWLPVNENTVQDIVRAGLCENATLEDSQTASTEADAFIGAMTLVGR